MTIDSIRKVQGVGHVKYGQGYDYTLQWQVDFHDGYDEAALVHNTFTGLPKIGDDMPGSTDTNCYADDVAVGLLSDSAVTTGTAYYTVKFAQKTAGFDANPLNRVDIQWGGPEDTETVRTDVDGNPILNSSGEL